MYKHSNKVLDYRFQVGSSFPLARAQKAYNQICVFAFVHCSSAGLHKNYWTDWDETWMEDGFRNWW